MLSRLLKLLSFSMASKLCLFFLQTLLTYILIISEYGLFGKWMTDINLFGALVVFGLDNSFIYHSNIKENIFINFIRSFAFYILITFILIIGLFLFDKHSDYYVYLFVYIFFSAIYQVFCAFFLLQEKYNTYGFFGLIRYLIPLVVFFILFLSKINLDFNQVSRIYLYILILSTLSIASLVILDIFRKNLFIKENLEGFFDLSYYLFGAKSVANTFLAILLYTSTIYYISFFGSSDQIAIFFVASTISKMMWVLPDTIGSLLYPVFVKINNTNDKNKAFEKMDFYLKICMLVNITVLVGFLIFGLYFIKFLYSDFYIDAYYYVLILLVGNHGMVIYKILSRYMASRNEWHGLRIALILGALSNFLINLLFFDGYGLLAASIATSVSFWVCGFVVAFSNPGMLSRFFKLPKLNEIIK